ncbi:hypothetical protein Tco_0281351 [Tanacetum coccineum]
MLAYIHTKPIYSATITIHSESASEHDVSTSFKVGVDSGLSAPKDSISQTKGNDDGPNKLSLDHMFAGTNPSVLVDKTKSTRDGLKTVHTKTGTNLESGKSGKESKADEDAGFVNDEFNTPPALSSLDDAKPTIKLEDLSKLVPDLDADFMDLDSPEDDKPIIVEYEEEEELKSIAEIALISAQPSFPNVEQLTKLLVKSLKPELSTLLTCRNFSKSLATELKELPSKFNDLSREIKELKKYVEKLEVELPRNLKEISNKLEKFTSTISSLTTQSKIKTLDALLSLLSKVTKALDRFVQVVEQSSYKAGDQGVPSAGQVGTHPVEGEKNTKQATIPQRALLNLMGELIKKSMSSKDAEEESTKSESDDANLTGSRVKSSKKRKLKKFYFVIEEGEHVHLTKEQIKEQRKIKELAKADLAKQEVELEKEELIDLLVIDVVKGSYKAKLQYDKYCDKMLNRRTRMDYLHKTEAELEIDFSKPFSEQDPPDKLNDLAIKKRKRANDIHDYFRLTKKFKSSLQ